MKTREKIRKYYKKPQITEVKLEIDEAVLTHCKLNDQTVGSGTKKCGGGTGPRCQNTQGS